jgi:hypothetical protein
MTDNNGNLLKQQIYIPGHTMRWQQYEYDSLNRLNSAREVPDGGAEQWKQQFTYDRWVIAPSTQPRPTASALTTRLLQLARATTIGSGCPPDNRA